MARPRTIVINKDDLENLYLKKRLSLDLIASQFNCGKRTIFDRLHKYKIPIRYDKEREDITKEKLEDLYIDKKMSIGKIAQAFKCGKNTIWSKLCKYNVKKRTKSEASKGRCKIKIPEEIKSLYINNKLSISEIARRLNHCPKTISQRLHGHNITTGIRKIEISKKELKGLYIKDKMTIYQIGQKFGCDAVTILNRLKQYNIPARKKGESNIGRYRVEIPVVEIKNLYIERKTPISKMKKMFNCHATTMRKRLERCGVPIRSISEALKGNPSPMSGKHHTEETRKKLSALTVKQLASGRMKRKDTIIEKKIEEGLILNRIYYRKQVPLCGITVSDFYLPDYKLAIYTDGDYWHNLPTVKIRDEKQNKILEGNGYQVLRFWEHEINESIVECISRVKDFIKV